MHAAIAKRIFISTTGEKRENQMLRLAVGIWQTA
jgi:hypothetical protein